MVVGLPAVAAQRNVAKIDFNREVRPILSDHCYACHGPDENKRKAGLRLDRPEEALKTLKSGERAIVPGDTRRSTPRSGGSDAAAQRGQGVESRAD